MYDEELAIAIAAVREAAELCQSIRGAMDKSTFEKADRSPVTIADFGSQGLICSRLHAAFPDDPIIAEEDSSVLRDQDNRELRDRMMVEVHRLRPDASPSDVLDWIDFGRSKDYSDRFWTLDPIDGTKGFLRGDQYAIALALIVGGRVAVAVVGCPNLGIPQVGNHTGVLLSAIAGKGARVFTLPDVQDAGVVSVSEASDPAMVRFCESFEAAHTSHSGARTVADKMGIKADSVRLDSQAKYAVVASGSAEIYMRLPSDRRYVENIWDHAAGSLLVEEAGGKVTDVAGKALNFGLGYRLENNRGVIVSNGVVHDRLIDAIRQAGIS